MKIVLVLVLLAFFSSVLAAPASSVSASGVVAGSTGSESDIPKIITLDDHGNVGVNFLGFRASAGLGGLLSGNLAEGGLHAEAGTPFGQAAGAGLGGTVDNDGNNRGYKYKFSSKNGIPKRFRFLFDDSSESKTS